MQNLANSKDFLEIFQKLFKLNINLENFSNDLLNHKKDRFQIYSENYSNLSLQVATWAFDLYELLGVNFLKAENAYYS